MPCEPIKPAAEKQHISSEGDQSSLQEKASKTDIEDMPFNVTCKMVQNLLCDPCPSDEWGFCRSTTSRVHKVVICHARGCSIRLSKLYDFRDSHLF